MIGEGGTGSVDIGRATPNGGGGPPGASGADAVTACCRVERSPTAQKTPTVPTVVEDKRVGTGTFVSLCLDRRDERGLGKWS